MTWFWTGPEDRGLSEQSVAAYLATAAARELATRAIARQHAPTDGRRPTAPCSWWARRLGPYFLVREPERLVLAVALLDASGSGAAGSGAAGSGVFGSGEFGSDERERLGHALACLDALGLARADLASLLLELQLLPAVKPLHAEDHAFEPDITATRLARLWGLCALASGRAPQPWLRFAVALAEPLALLQGILDLVDDDVRVGPPRVGALLRACRARADALAPMLDACAGALEHVDRSVALRSAATTPAVLEQLTQRREQLLADARAALPADGAEAGEAFLAAVEESFAQSSRALWMRGLMTRAMPSPVSPAATASESIRAAVDQLVHTRPWSGAWDVHRFHPMGAPCVLVGRWFIDGMILLALTEVRGANDQELANAITALLEWVPAGSARYFPEWAEGLPPDADSLGLALQLAAWLQDPPRAHVDSWIAVLEASLHADRANDQIVPTWLVEAPSGRTTALPGPFLGDECTAVTLAFLLGALRYDAERFAALFRPNLEIVLARGCEAGSQHYMREFTTHLLIRLVCALRSHASSQTALPGQLAGLPKQLSGLPGQLGLDAMVAERCAALVASQRLDGGWGSPQATALALEALVEWDPSSACIGRAVSYLVHSQGPDGAWSAEPLYITPGKFGGMVPFAAKELTTALCVRALQRASR